jgi:hypothetical protein
MNTLHRIAFAWLLALCLASCDKAASGKLQGYVEGEYVYGIPLRW